MSRRREKHELRHVSSILEEYIADLAKRAGVPRPGILSLTPPLTTTGSHQRHDTNTRSDADPRWPSSKPRV